MAYFNGKEILLACLKGEPGISPHVGDNGNWFVGDKDTGVPAGGMSEAEKQAFKDAILEELGEETPELPAVSETDSGKVLQVVDGEWTASNYELSERTEQNYILDSWDPNAWKKNACSMLYAKPDGYVGVRFRELRIGTNGAGTVRFAVYNRVDSEDGASAVLTLEKILGEVQASAEKAVTTLIIDGGYYTEAESPVVVIHSTTENLGFIEVGSGVAKNTILIDDVDFSGTAEGESVTAPIGEMSPLALPYYYLLCDDVLSLTTKNFAKKTNERLNAMEEGNHTNTGIHVGPDAPTGDETVWVDTDDEAEDGGSGLPTVTASDNGKVLRVVDGAWAAAELSRYLGEHEEVE